MENLSQITDLSEIKSILDCGNKIFITDGENELYTTNIDEVKKYILKNNYQFYEVMEYNLLEDKSTVIKEDVKNIAASVEYEWIVNSNYNLSVSTYVEKEDTTEKVDIVELNARLQEIVKKENQLRAEIDEIIKEIEGLQL